MAGSECAEGSKFGWHLQTRQDNCTKGDDAVFAAPDSLLLTVLLCRYCDTALTLRYQEEVHALSLQS